MEAVMSAANEATTITYNGGHADVLVSLEACCSWKGNHERGDHVASPKFGEKGLAVRGRI